MSIAMTERQQPACSAETSSSVELSDYSTGVPTIMKFSRLFPASRPLVWAHLFWISHIDSSIAPLFPPFQVTIQKKK